MHFIVVIKAERIATWKCERARQNFGPYIFQKFLHEISVFL